jgi:hypothetical protein
VEFVVGVVVVVEAVVVVVVEVVEVEKSFKINRLIMFKSFHGG